MSKASEFEDKLGDLITEHFETKEQLLEGITYFKGTDLGEVLKDNLHCYEDLE